MNVKTRTHHRPVVSMNPFPDRAVGVLGTYIILGSSFVVAGQTMVALDARLAARQTMCELVMISTLRTEKTRTSQSQHLIYGCACALFPAMVLLKQRGLQVNPSRCEDGFPFLPPIGRNSHHRISHQETTVSHRMRRCPVIRFGRLRHKRHAPKTSV